MPEAPEMQVVAEFLDSRLSGERVRSARILKPMVRSLCGDFEQDIVGRDVQCVWRRGKFLLIDLRGGRRIVINPKLTGGVQHCPTQKRVQKRVCVRIRLDDDTDFRYIDSRQMGQFYYLSEDLTEQVPGFSEQGLDVLDEFEFEQFADRLKGFHGEIKGILTRGRVVSGVGNAYADEILFDARVYPFRRRKSLSEDELRRIYDSARRVVAESVEEVRSRMGAELNHKARDFLRVHNRGGQPCPNCGRAITELRANQRITSYCRSCQPGMLIKN